ncbi:MAG: hypothetical protein Q9179_001150 [Wetmoreana sp. 5 TL-2023]
MRRRGDTPFSDGSEQYPIIDEPEPHLIDDPDLLAKLEELHQLGQAREAEHIQAAVDAANADCQPPPDIDSSDREESPIGGLPSPTPSPRTGYSQLPNSQLSPSATNNLTTSQPGKFVTLSSDSDSEAKHNLPNQYYQTHRIQQIQDPHYGVNRPDALTSSPTTNPRLGPNNPLDNQIPPIATSDPPPSQSEISTEQPSKLKVDALEYRQRRNPQRSIITTRSKLSSHTLFWELDNSARPNRNATFRPIRAKKPNDPARGV